MLSEKMGIDNIDCVIMDLIQKKPHLTHAQIAEHVNRSQPTIGMRIKKLEKMGVLKYQAGITLKNRDLCFARVDIQTNNPQESLKMIRKCPFMLNAFSLSGNKNISILVVGLTFKVLEQIVNHHFRSNPVVTEVQMDIIVDVVEDLVLPLNFNIEHTKICPVCNENHNHDYYLED
ncbi:MAG: Lrp/AsnC family transcriptional regulator [Promethearchaeota archaeon]|jgi:DNA-binding Lrp family transcriptional regulator